MANRESLAYQELKEVMEDLELQDQKDLKVTREILGQMDHQVHLEMMENMGKGALLVQRVRRVSLASKVGQVPEDLLEWKDQKEILEHLVFLEILGSRALVASKENLEILATMEERVTEVFRAILDLQANLDCKGLQANLVCLDLLVNKEMLDHQEQKETLAHW